MQNSVILYHFPLSPFCRKLRLALAEKGFKIQTKEEEYWKRRKEFLRISPAGQVPVLRMGNTFFTDSQAICEFVEAAFHHPKYTQDDPEDEFETLRLIPDDPEAAYEVRRLTFWIDGVFYRDVTSRLLDERVHKFVRGVGRPDSKSLRFAFTKLKEHFDYMERLLDERRWLAGQRISLADLTAAAHLSSLDYLDDVDWSRGKWVKDWYARMKSRPSFRPLLQDYLPGFNPPDQYTDLDF